MEQGLWLRGSRQDEGDDARHHLPGRLDQQAMGADGRTRLRREESYGRPDPLAGGGRRSPACARIAWHESRLEAETGSVEPGQMGGHKPKAISGEYAVWLRQRIRESDFTLRGLVAELAERGLKVDYRSVCEFVYAEKLSFKKGMVAGERDRPDVARRRSQWTKYQDRVDIASPTAVTSSKRER